jgi:hypothetical protein
MLSSIRSLFSCAPLHLLIIPVFTFLLSPAAAASLQIESRWGKIPSRPGVPVLLTISIHWPGEPELYAISPPELDLPEGLSKEKTSSSSFSRGEETYLEYAVTLLISRSGSFAPIPITLSVRTKGEGEPSSMVVRTEPLTVGDQHWKGIPAKYLPAAGLVIATLIATGIFWRLRKARRSRPTNQGQQPDKGQELWVLLAQGRTYLVRADSLSFLQTALTIERALQDKEPDALSEVTTLIERVQYGGERPPPEKLERMYRGLRLRLQQRFPRETDNETEFE